MTTVRRSVAAGRFYPLAAGELAAVVDRLLGAAQSVPPGGELCALVAPHAGYAYSGAVAATAFAAVSADGRSRRVALLGPSHFVALDGVAVTGADAWQTPLGTVRVDGDLRASALAAGAEVDDGPHRHDHALEVELPFLQRVVGEGLCVLPAAVGGAAEAAAVVSAVAADALVVVSSDLSHYHDDATARRLDGATAEAVLALDPGRIGQRDACGADALRGLLLHARQAGWTAKLLDLRTSADACGDFRHVVGYGAFAFVA